MSLSEPSLPEQSQNLTLTIPKVTVPEVTVPKVTVPEVADHRIIVC